MWLHSFQFHKGTIRTECSEPALQAHPHFNSIKVQLERLDDTIDGNEVTTFQFHKGTIRTRLRSMIFVDGTSFQFHKGTIRTDLCLGFDWFGSISIP